MSFVERSIRLCPYLGGSTIGGSTLVVLCVLLTYSFLSQGSQQCYGDGYYMPEHTCACAFTVCTCIHIEDNPVINLSSIK